MQTSLSRFSTEQRIERLHQHLLKLQKLVQTYRGRAYYFEQRRRSDTGPDSRQYWLNFARMKRCQQAIARVADQIEELRSQVAA